MQRVSKVFKEIVAGAKVGDDVLPKIERHTGHKGTGITARTINAWADEGLVTTKVTRNGRTRTFVAVKVTGAGKRLAADAVKRTA